MSSASEHWEQLLTPAVWWVVNLEIATDPSYDGQEIDEKGIVPGPILIIQMMLEVLSGNEELLKHYRDANAGKA